MTMGIIRRLLGLVTFSCMRITELVESKETTKLTFRERVKYNLHMVFCKACKSYEKQSVLIGKALSRLMFSSPQDIKTMDESSKQKILDQIRNNES